MNKKLFCILLISILIATISAIAATAPIPLDPSFQEGINAARSHMHSTDEGIKNFKPGEVYKEYNENPPQTKYNQGGITQGDTHELQAAASSEVNVNDAGKTVVDSSKTHDQYPVNPNSYEMQRGGMIIGHSLNIVTGTPDPDIDCKNSQICHTTYIKQYCNESTRNLPKVCFKTPQVTIVDEPYTEPRSYSGSMNPSTNFSGTFAVPVTGTITSFHTDLQSGKNIWKCKVNYNSYVQGAYSGSCTAHCGDGTNGLHFTGNPNAHVSGSSPITFSFQGGASHGLWSSAPYSLSMIAELHRKVPRVDWVEDCHGSGSVCVDKENICVEPGGTRYFDGIPVTLPCWKYRITKQCTAPSDNNCQPLRDQGCSQVGAKCRVMLEDICAVQDETYDCPVKKCDGYGIVCNDGSSYCLTGNCADQTRIPDKDMARSLAALSAAADASKQFDPNNLAIFTGKVKECSDDFVKFCDCCVDSGWGQDIHLASCNQDEKELGHAKEAGLVIKVGRYCKNETLGVCTEHRTSHCVFNSKLARIIRNAGREQLGIGFGTAEKPNCRGLTPEELEHIDFSKIDFSEVYEDIKNKMQVQPTDKTNAKISQDASELYKNGKAHG